MPAAGTQLIYEVSADPDFFAGRGIAGSAGAREVRVNLTTAELVIAPKQRSGVEAHVDLRSGNRTVIDHDRRRVVRAAGPPAWTAQAIPFSDRLAANERG